MARTLYHFHWNSLSHLIIILLLFLPVLLPLLSQLQKQHYYDDETTHSQQYDNDWEYDVRQSSVSARGCFSGLIVLVDWGCILCFRRSRW